MVEDRKRVAGENGLPEAPRLPERAAIYIAPDGTVHFGALFEGLVPVAQALGAPNKVERLALSVERQLPTDAGAPPPPCLDAERSTLDARPSGSGIPSE